MGLNIWGTETCGAEYLGLTDFTQYIVGLRGQGVFEFGILKYEFMYVYDARHGGLPYAFYRIKKYCFWPDLSRFKNWILHTITLLMYDLIAIISKSKI